MNYSALVSAVPAENRQVLEAVDPNEVERFVQEKDGNFIQLALDRVYP
jgi:hypothetical protein